MRASVLTPFVDITPGEPVEVQLEVVNTLDIVDLISIDLPDLARAEFRLDRESVSLFPNETAVVTMTLQLRKTFPAGPGRIEVRLASALRPDLVEWRQVAVDVAPFAGAELSVTPEAIVAKSKMQMRAFVRNTGNTSLNVALLAKDDQGDLRFVLQPPSLLVEPETEAMVLIEGKGRRPLFGTPAYRSVHISAESEAGLLDDTVTVTQRPLLVRGMLTALVLASIIALWAIIVTTGVDFVLKSDPAPKGVPLDFAAPVSYSTLASVGSAGAVGGSGSSSVAALLGSISGTVVGADSGEPIPRIAVEAHRANRKAPDAPFGSDATRVQSAATDENGAFTLDGIFPGTYKLKLVGPGFEDSWYPGVPSVDQATEVTIEAGEDRQLDPVPASGLLGTITGTIDAGDQTAVITVVVRPLVNDVPAFEVARLDVTPPDLDGDGYADGPATYEVPGLASPMKYSISVSSGEFADQRIIETLAAGQRLEAAPIRLVPGEGRVIGTIVLQGSPPNGPVTVTATTGDTSFTLDTPAPSVIDSGDGITSTVDFAFSGLPAPGTYSLSFAAAGFETAFSSVDVEAGPDVDAGQIVMTGGSRTFSGRVLDAETGLRLGDVDVTVLTSDGTISTKTLPAPLTLSAGAASDTDCRSRPPVPAYDPASSAGSFVFDNLPLGVLSITFSAPGYTSITHRIDVTGDGSPVPITDGFADHVVELSNTIGEVCGTVRGSDGAGLGAGAVLLRGGPRPAGSSPETRSPTPLSSDPVGSYKIAGMAAGEYTLTASADGYRDCTVVFRIDIGTRDARLRILDMQLVDASDPPSAACTVSEGAP